jgi:hypothetical protein
MVNHRSRARGGHVVCVSDRFLYARGPKEYRWAHHAPDEQMLAMYFPDHHRRGRLCKGLADHEARYHFSIDDKLEGNNGSIYENNKEGPFLDEGHSRTLEAQFTHAY